MKRAKRCPQCGVGTRAPQHLLIRDSLLEKEVDTRTYFWCNSVQHEDGSFTFSEDCTQVAYDKLVQKFNALRKDNSDLRKRNKRLESSLSDLDKRLKLYVRELKENTFM